MEYIKNIVLHYIYTNYAGREQMTSAIATALHFSEDEVSGTFYLRQLHTEYMYSIFYATMLH